MSWESDIRAIHADACGLMSLDIIQPGDLKELLAGAEAGRRRHALLWKATIAALEGIERAPASEPKLCATCPSPVRYGSLFSLAVATPHRDEASSAVSFAICSRCATTRNGVRERAITAIKKIWPEARPLEVQHPAGHA